MIRSVEKHRAVSSAITWFRRQVGFGETATIPQNKTLNLEKVKAIIFDLDGTLYSLSKGPFGKRYLEMIGEYLPANQKEAFFAEWKKAAAGRSLFRSGRVYDEKNRKVLVLDRHGRVAKGFETWGMEISRQEILRLYPQPVRPNQPGFVFMEGGVWVLTGLARSFGINWKTHEEVYRKIYDEVYNNPRRYFDPLRSKLPEFFSKLKEKKVKIFVLTNTNQPMSEAILKALGIWNRVDQLFARAKKPEKSREYLHSILNTYHLKPGDILSVGDSINNDLLVPHELGMQTLLIEDFPAQCAENTVDAKVPTIDSLIEAFYEFWKG